MGAHARCIEAFTDLGVTELEAGIYVCLLQCSPATGYKVAKEIGATQRTFDPRCQAFKTPNSSPNLFPGSFWMS